MPSNATSCIQNRVESRGGPHRARFRHREEIAAADGKEGFGRLHAIALAADQDRPEIVDIGLRRASDQLVAESFE
jgi:hypothetical protein